MDFYIALFVALLSLSFHTYSSPVSVDSRKTPLMVSHLSSNQIKSLKLNNNLSYASHHSFYDTPITLADKSGRTIHFKEELDTNERYTIISQGETTEAFSMIWFFSPEGSVQIYSEGVDVCPAENPCKQITQNLIDGISKEDDTQLLWFATGFYELPVIQGQFNQAKLIEFYSKQHVFGRTSDFRHKALNKDRPLFSGTLSWNAYSGHEGSQNFVENIRVNTDSNYIEVEHFYVDTNLYSAGHLMIRDCVLNKMGGSNSDNVVAKKVFIEYSDLNAEGEFQGANIEANEIDITGTRLKMKSLLGSNIVSENGSLFVYNSVLSLQAEGCQGTAINMKRMDYASIVYSKISVNAEDECPRGGILSGIEETVDYKTKATRLTGSEIAVSSKYGNAYALVGSKAIQLDGTALFVKSLQSGVAATNYVERIVFVNNPSYLSIISPEPSIFFQNSNAVLNHSIPPSLCRINNNDFKDCSLDGALA
ncbi:hypothetical protein [Legionella worsleiensis]|uniref:Uncharacterized protein n=1 Tax=Legionella worsleiensis TaxID=45076 RepID=A0A0W1AEJ2_9GAMM|nr:hypothetical protein [Legionella worsleiensis]KTD79710.1 hypothetical protein Lwor_1224 [Legionella worsleiensis]STY32221.1 Uncharacterised protein [Legionella worsleiensis]